MQNALIFIVKTITDLYLLTYLLRFIMQWTRADFYNPFGQLIVKVTNPLVVPARRLLPSIRGVDVPTLVVLLLLEALAILLLLALVGAAVPAGTFVAYVVLRLIDLALWFYTIAIFVYVILSWIGQGRYSPLGEILADLVEPVLRPARRILPPIAGLDLSPVLVLILLQAIVIALPLPGVLR
ncbi:MAG TPA: YggT family protein [Gammaproteobacteria bacterium]